MSIVAGDVLEHFKGGKYKVIFIAKDAEDEEAVVVYLSLKHATIWTRKLSRFYETVKWPDGVTRCRFIKGDMEDE